MTEVTEYNDVTKDLLERIKDLKKDIRNSMMHGEYNILKGIVIFETILKEFNPRVLDDNEIAKIEGFVRRYLIEKEEKMQHVNAYVHYGINRCFLILESYNNVEEEKIEKKRNFWFTFK